MKANERSLETIDRFRDETAARRYMEAKRWPDGPVCPHCGEVNNAYRLVPQESEKDTHVRNGVWKCGGCREQFSITVGTVFEDSHVPLYKWLFAIHMLCSSKKGMSAHQLFRMMGTFYGKRGSYKTAWFMFHRLRFAMTQHPFVDKLKGIVEIDETWVGPKERGTGLRGAGNKQSKKRPVVALMERTDKGSRVRSFPVERVTLENIKPIMKEHVEVGTCIQTDEAAIYHWMGPDYPQHDIVTHAKKEYSRHEEDGRHVTTNTVEGYFGLFKRGLYGTYHHIGRGYMQQYLNEFDFRYNNRKLSDLERVDLTIKATEAKRLTMRAPKSDSVV
jgi:transposase-like protein